MGKENFQILFNLINGTEIITGKAYQYTVDWSVLGDFGDDYEMVFTAHSNFAAFTQANPVFIECSWGNQNSILAMDTNGNVGSNVIGFFNPTYTSTTTLTYDTTTADNSAVYISNLNTLAKTFIISFTAQSTGAKVPISFTFANFCILMDFRRVKK